MTHRADTKQLLRLLFWESTIKCNLACAHCRRLESDAAADSDMSTTQARQLIDQLAQLGQGQSMMPVIVFSGGEPLCRPDIFALTEYATSLQIPSALATNGTMLNEKIAAKIKGSGITRVSVSLDGADAETHNRLRRQHGAFDRAVEGISHLRAADVPFQINFTLTKHNTHQLADVYNLAKSLGAVALHIFMLVPVGCGQVLAETDMLSPEQYEAKMIEIYQLEKCGDLQLKVTCGPHYQRVIRQQGGPPGDNPGGHRPSKGCLAGLGVLFVSHAGDVFPCGYLPVNCGNVLNQPLSDIWRTSPDLARMRDTTALEGKCRVCGYREICGGCRARAYAATGNYMAEEPFCAYIPPEAAH